MRQIVEVAWDSLCKYGEELCGDWVKVTRTQDALNIVLSDGLGSGVKANILATLTVEIASSMLEHGATTDEVLETLTETLPECQERHLAYAAFAALHIINGREAYLVEYDSEPLILVRNDQLVDLPMVEREVAGRTIREGSFTLQEGDTLVMLSDGYVHAGVGGLYRFGWGWKNIATAVRRWVETRGDAHQLVRSLQHTCLKLYGGEPGDDSTAIGMRVRQSRAVTVFTGPPSKPTLDEQAVQRLIDAPGRKVICGGTTAQVAARVLDRELKVEWLPPSQRGETRKHKLPPVAKLDGIDLVTEGILTLSSTVDLLKQAETIHDLSPGQEADDQLARLLLAADDIRFIVGDALNPNQLADVVRGKPMRQVYLEALIEVLTKRHKQVSVEHI
ncbi:MAG: serine/threonine-protein phosphatase [Anaerolineae bacterium]|nr:serine/threonine-protein phosphatase [Anaerolineae bacterium]